MKKSIFRDVIYVIKINKKIECVNLKFALILARNIQKKLLKLKCITRLNFPMKISRYLEFFVIKVLQLWE